MPKYRAIITDLDQTLLRSDKTLTDHSAAALKKAQEKGLLVMAATARPQRTIQKYQEQVGFDAVTTLNGARTIIGNRVVERCFPIETGSYILSKLSESKEALVSIETSQGIFANRYIPEWETADWPEYPILPEGVSLYKILVSEVEQEIVESALAGDAYFTRAQGKLFQIMSRHICKWNGIQDLMDVYDLAPEEVVYFGDDFDDEEPIRLCGLGIAVSNAVPSVLDAADLVVGSNEEDAVAAFLDQWLEEI